MSDQAFPPRRAALELYKPPFKHDGHGYIRDANNEAVADQALHALRVRGWGRIRYMENPEVLQDTVGDLIAEALTKFWQEELAKR